MSIPTSCGSINNMDKVTHCRECGTRLSKESRDADRDVCVDCYSDSQD